MPIRRNRLACRLGTSIALAAIALLAAAPSASATDAKPALGDSVAAGGGRAPETTITKAPKRTTQRHRATFKFRSSERRSTFECRLDGRRFKRCDSPKTYRDLKRGRRLFEVRASDRGGHTDRTPARWRWRVGHRTTAGGASLVSDIVPGGGNSSPCNLTNVAGTLFFRSHDGTHGIELWRSDGRRFQPTGGLTGRVRADISGTATTAATRARKSREGRAPPVPAVRPSSRDQE